MIASDCNQSGTYESKTRVSLWFLIVCFLLIYSREQIVTRR